MPAWRRRRTKRRIRQEGMIVAPMNAQAFRAFVEHEALRWKPVILKGPVSGWNSP